MVALLRDAADPLVQPVLGAGDEPERRLDEEIVVLPENGVVAQERMHIGRVEEAGAAAVHGHVEMVRVGLVAQHGQDDGIGDALGCTEEPIAIAVGQSVGQPNDILEPNLDRARMVAWFGERRRTGAT
jgi:hypothetical protein